MDARDKKEAMLLVQSQVKDAESLAKATKQEAERLNKAAEDAQLSAAAAASMQDQPSPHEINGYSFKTPPTPASSFAMGPPLSSQPLQYGIPNNNHTMPDGGFGGPSLGGFDAHVMGTGNGGVDIPTPSGISDPYDNPFE